MTKTERIEQLQEVIEEQAELNSRLTVMYMKQLEVQDAEIERLNVIINYLETKDL